MKNQLKIILGLVALVSTTWGGFIDAIRDFDNDYSTIPAVLSETGMYSDFANKVVAEDLIYYEVNTPYWVDGTHKKRWIWLPPGTQITPNDSIGWDYPEGTVIVKNFSLDTIVGDPSSEITIETRIIVKRATRWRYMTYEWRIDQTEANLADKRLGNEVFFRRHVNGTQVLFRWKYPTNSECLQCHAPTIGSVGMNGPNMNLTSPLDGTKNQLQDLAERGVFSVNLLTANPTLHKWAGIDDPEASLEVKSRSWFAMNCGYCHADDQSPGGAHSFTYWQAEKEANYLDLQSFAYAEFPKVIVPGFPDSSYFLKRMTERKTFTTFNGDQMPPVMTYKVDSAAVEVISDWICELGGQAAGCNRIPWENPGPVEEDEFVIDPEYYQPKIKALPVIPHAMPNAEFALSAFIKNQTLYVNGLNVNASQVQLMDLKGKAIELLPLGEDSFYVKGSLKTGVYVLKAGSKILKFNYMF